MNSYIPMKSCEFLQILMNSYTFVHITMNSFEFLHIPMNGFSYRFPLFLGREARGPGELFLSPPVSLLKAVRWSCRRLGFCFVSASPAEPRAGWAHLLCSPIQHGAAAETSDLRTVNSPSITCRQQTAVDQTFRSKIVF